MKVYFIYALLLVSASLSLRAEENAKCSLNNNGVMSSFVKTDGDPTDRDIHTIEKKLVGDFKFLLKQGHGILRLEAYKANKFHSATLIQESSIPQNSDLNLQVIDDSGNDLEVLCTNLIDD